MALFVEREELLGPILSKNEVYNSRPSKGSKVVFKIGMLRQMIPAI